MVLLSVVANGQTPVVVEQPLPGGGKVVMRGVVMDLPLTDSIVVGFGKIGYKIPVSLLRPTILNFPVVSVAGKVGIVTLTKSDVGLSLVQNVDATARANHTGTQPANTITGLATVATTGSYNDLTNKPVLPSGGTIRILLAGDVTNNNAVANTIADVTGLSFPVVSGSTYKFRFVIIYTAQAATTGSRWSINGPSTSFLHYRSNYTLTATSRTFNEGLTGYNTPAASNASSITTSNMAVIEGILTASANGNVIARFASEIANSAIVAKAKSYVEYELIQ